ncbi:hypothetical protein [Marinobacter sp. P4B1]|uniref:hypothetical protein n=1 Tax=Marinobacter sp. P4B1 TaxID=1119533 RepID=UPI00071D4875|nr:hypothetical protein [Marinobacter sp. P4B1]KRW83714.1 hypothetical protein AQ621_16830 [Marinobacter sp. P4B1]
MSQYELNSVAISSMPVYRATLCPLSALDQSITSDLINYVRANILTSDNEPSKSYSEIYSPFELRQPSLFSDGSFPVSYYCDSVQGAIDALAQRIVDMLPVYAGADIDSSALLVVESKVSGRFLDVSRNEDAALLDPMGDWQNFGRTVRADSSFGGILFSDDDSFDESHQWLAIFNPETLSVEDIRVTRYTLSVNDGEPVWHPI